MNMANVNVAVPKPAANEVLLITGGDLRLSANQVCWPAQRDMEEKLTAAFAQKGFKLIRAQSYDDKLKHGFIASQRQGMDVFMKIHPDARLVFATAAWQYSHHVLPGLRSHRGPILTVANWSGQWPGLVGLLNLNGSLVKAGTPFATIWSKDFTDDYFQNALDEWLRDGKITHDVSHVRALDAGKLPAASAKLGAELAAELKHRKAIMGVFDEGCMGMYNGIIEDALLLPLGVGKERLSQSALYAEMLATPDAEARAVREWLDRKGMRFLTGPDPAVDLTDAQVLDQCKMYIAALRIADDFGCDVIGIQYQQGLKDLVPASDLAEGILNNVNRPPVRARGNGRVLYEGRALPHFNEVDECAGVDALITNRVWNHLGLSPETTLHDVRYGEEYAVDGRCEFVWLLEISGAVPPEHLVGGYAGAVSERQPPMYFRLGGGTIKGVSKPGEIVWSRVYIQSGVLNADIGRGRALALPKEETDRRWVMTTPQWPVMHAAFYGVSRDQMMAQHKSNHIQVAYTPDAAPANEALAVKAAAFRELGLEVNICGECHGLAGA